MLCQFSHFLKIELGGGGFCPGRRHIVPASQIIGNAGQPLQIFKAGWLLFTQNLNQSLGMDAYRLDLGNIRIHSSFQTAADILIVLGASNHLQRMAAGMSHFLRGDNHPLHSELLLFNIRLCETAYETTVKGSNVCCIPVTLVVIDQGI